jgi:hypothetical protein
MKRGALLIISILFTFTLFAQSPAEAEAAAREAQRRLEEALSGRPSGSGTTQSITPVQVTRGGTQPSWIDDPYTVYNRNFYIAVVGHAANRAEAEKHAFVELVSFFGMSTGNQFHRVGTLAGGNNIPGIFSGFTRDNNRTYFSAMSVYQSNNTGELANMAEQNAKMQALLWLGADIQGELSSYSVGVEQDGNMTKVQDFFEGTLKCTSRINLQSVSFQEEARHVQRGTDGKFYFYGLYSIINTLPQNTAGYNFFTYYTKQDNESFIKHVNFNGNNFTRDRIIAVRQGSEIIPRRTHQEINNLFDTLKHEEYNLTWIGYENNASVVIQNIKAMMDVLCQFAMYVNARTQFLMREFSADTGTVTDSNSLFLTETIQRTINSLTISNAVKIREEMAVDGTLYQIWRSSKSDFEYRFREMFRRLEEEIRMFEEALGAE